MDKTQIENPPKEELQTVTKTGTPVRRRLATPEAAYSVFNDLKLNDSTGEALRRAVIQGMIDGNPPYDPRELEEQGLASMTNVNFMSLRANLDARAAAAHELFMEVPTLVELRPRQVVQNNPEIYHWCSVISEEFSQLLNDWTGFLPAMDMVVRESDAYGIGPALFENPWDWRIKAFRRGNLLFDPKASVDVDKNEIYMIRDEMSAGELFDKIEDEDTARKVGWKPGPIKDLLVDIFIQGDKNNTEDRYQQSTWESLQHMARNNDPLYQKKQFEKVQVVHILVKEVSGDQKISHLIIPENCKRQVFLYEALDRYEKMSHALWWLPYNFGNGYARSVRGVASHMVQHDDLSNRFLCRVFDAGFMTSSMMVQPRTMGDLSRLQFVTHGPWTIVPPEVQAVQTSYQPQLAPLLQLRTVSENVMKNNTGSYRQHNEGIEREAQKTARQVVEESSTASRYEKAAVAHRYSQLDLVYREMFRRVMAVKSAPKEAKLGGYESAREFLKRCKERGVEDSFMKDWEKNVQVYATRALGLGSLGVKYDITNQLVQASGAFDEAGKREALRDWVAARAGYRNTDKYVSKLDRDQIPSNESSISLLEWNDIEEGSQTLVGSDQVHKLHLDVFLPRMGEILQRVETAQVQDPMQDYRTLGLAIQHCEQHLQFLAKDPRRQDYVKQVAQLLQLAKQSLGKLEAMAKRVLQQQQQAQAEQQALVQNAERITHDRELEAKIFEIQQKSELERMKQASLNSMRAEKTSQQMDISRGKAEADIRLRGERQQAEIEIARAKADAETSIKASRGERR